MPRVTGGSFTPSAMVVSDTLVSEGHVVRALVSSVRYRPPVLALYGQPGVGDPLDGSMLVVGTAFHDAVPVVPTTGTAGFRAADLGGRTVAVGRDRVWTWVTWHLPDCVDECQGFVVGRKLSEDEVLQAARGATADQNRPTVAPDALPRGLEPLVSGGFNLTGFSLAGAQLVDWSSGGGRVVLTVAPDDRLGLIMRFWMDGESVRIRGEVGSSGRTAKLGVGDSLQARAWSESGRALLVVSVRVSADALDRFAADLRGARDGEWEQVRGRTLDVSNESVVRRCSSSDGPLVALGRNEGRYRWVVGFGLGRGDEIVHCQIVLTAERSSLGSSGSPRPVRGGLSAAASGIAGATDPVGLFVMGVSPPGTFRVTAELADGRAIDAELADEGPATGERYYALFVEGDFRAQPTIVALDANGGELSRLTLGRG